MKTLHEIKTDPTIVDYMALRHPEFIWTIEGDQFVYWFKTGGRGERFRDYPVNDAKGAYERWLAAGANPTKTWTF